MEFVTHPLWIGKTHGQGIDKFDIGVQSVECLAKRLALHLAELFPSTVGLFLEFLAVKKFGMTIIAINGSCGELILFFIRQNYNLGSYSFV